MTKEFKLIDKELMLLVKIPFGEIVRDNKFYYKEDVKEAFRLLKEDFKDCKAIPKLCLPFIFEIINKRTGFKEDGGEEVCKNCGLEEKHHTLEGHCYGSKYKGKKFEGEE